MRRLDDINLDKIPPRKIQLLCLLLLGLVQCFNMLFGVLVDGPLKHYVVFYISILGFLFLGVSICQPMTLGAKKMLVLGGAFSAWILLLQFSDFVIHFSPTAYYGARFVFSVFLCEYLVLLPCAAILNEGDRPRGLRIVSGCYLLASLLFCVLTIMVFLGIIPQIFSRFMGWVGGRLGINWHPNQLSHIFMLGISVSLAFLFAAKKLWAKILLGLVAATEFAFLAFTNARTSILMICCLLAGVVFFGIYENGTKKGNWKRFLIGILLAVLLIGLLYSLSDWINQQSLYWQATSGKPQNSVSEEAIAQVQSQQRELSYGMSTLNGRTYVWSAALQGIREHPVVLLTGVKDPGKFITAYYPDGVAHAHNAWMETLLRLGVVGLAFALILTYLAVRSVIRILFFRRTSMSQKIIAMTVICALGVGIFEPQLFYAECPISFYNVFFVLSLGYLVYWESQTEVIRSEKAGANV